MVNSRNSPIGTLNLLDLFIFWAFFFVGKYFCLGMGEINIGLTQQWPGRCSAVGDPSA